MFYAIIQFIPITYLIITANFSQFIWLNWLLILIGAVIGYWALFTMRLDNFNIVPELKANHKLVTHGIYRYIRHPIYTALIIEALALVLSRPQIDQWLAYLLLAIIFFFKSRKEEFYLLNRFDNYKNYQKNTGRFLPFL